MEIRNKGEKEQRTKKGKWEKMWQEGDRRNGIEAKREKGRYEDKRMEG